MMILVGVTINFAINGGIITKSKQAASRMQIEADREALLSAVIASIGLDGKVDFETLDIEAGKVGFTGSNGTYTSKAGNVFTVDEDGNITYTGEGESGSQVEDQDLVYLKSLIGQTLGDIIEDMSGPVFKDSNMELDQEAVNNMDSNDIIDNGDGTYTMQYPILYKNKPYSMAIRFNPNDQMNSTITDVRTRTATTTSSISSSETIQESKLAKYVRFENDSTLWRVLYDDETYGLQLISANTLEVDNVYLGYEDNIVDWTDLAVISEANLFEDTESRTKCVIRCRKSNILI